MTKNIENRMANAVAQAGFIYGDELSLNMISEEELITAAQAGDQASFRSLYVSHRGEVQRIVYRLLGPTADVDDVIQDVFLQVHKSIRNFRGNSKFSTWLHRVAVNVTLQHLRRKRTTVVSRPDDKVEERACSESFKTPHEEAETKDRLRAVYRTLDQLSPKKRAVLVMHDMQGLSAQKIAEIIGSPVFTVRTRLFYARREFYKKITNEPAFSGDISADELKRR